MAKKRTRARVKPRKGPALPAANEYLDPKLIAPSPYQPRSDWPEQQIEELAESIRERGQLQACVVRPQGKRYELIAGERRLRAAKRAGVPALVRIVEVDDATAAELCLAENLDRKDLGPIAKARGFANVLEATGKTQAEVAERFKLSQPAIANALRLLKLPEAWQKRIDSGAVTVGAARVLLQCADYPQVLEWLGKNTPCDDPELPLDRETAETMLEEALDECSRPLNGTGGYVPGKGYVWCYLTRSQAHREDLQRATFAVHGQKLTRAMNVELWEQLNEEQLEKRREKGARPGPVKRNGKAEDLTPAQQRKQDREREAEREKQLAGRLWTCYVDWLRYLTARRLGEPPQRDDPPGVRWAVTRLLLYLAADQTAGAGLEQTLRGAVAELGGKAVKWDRKTLDGLYSASAVNVWSSTFGDRDDHAGQLAERFVRLALWDGDGPAYGGRGPMVHDNVVCWLAGELDVNHRGAWRDEQMGPLTDRFYGILNRDDVAALAERAKVDLAGAKTKAAIVEQLKGYQVPYPKQLEKIKPPK